MTDPTVTVLGQEPMIDAMQAAGALRLPYDWFSDPAMRARHSLIHDPRDAPGSPEAQGGQHD